MVDICNGCPNFGVEIDTGLRRYTETQQQD
jgi:hypothetical protein